MTILLDFKGPFDGQTHASAAGAGVVLRAKKDTLISDVSIVTYNAGSSLEANTCAKLYNVTSFPAKLIATSQSVLIPAYSQGLDVNYVFTESALLLSDQVYLIALAAKEPGNGFAPFALSNTRTTNYVNTDLFQVLSHHLGESALYNTFHLYGLNSMGGRADSMMIKINGSIANTAPTINLTSPTANATLYENDTFNIDGSVKDADSGNSVTVRYQINANTVRAIKAFVSDGTTLEAFSKQLRFSGGNLYDGDTLIAAGLADGVAHKLKVWATDDQGGTSDIVERDFYVVPNRVPILTVNPPVITGNINADKITIDGTYSELDGNTAKVTYRINGGSSVQVAEGTGGGFDFEISFGQLQVGLNTIVIEAIDSYGAKTSRTVKLNKNEVKTEQLKSVARFRISPPNKTATGIVVWVHRDPNLLLDAKMSMHQTGEAEHFVAMTKAVTAPVPNVADMLEDQYQYEVATAVDNIILQIDMERTSTAVNDKIYLLVGVID